MSLSCTRKWCEAEIRLHVGEHVVVEHSTTLERVAVGEDLLVVRLVAHGDEEPTVVLESENRRGGEPLEVIAMPPATGHALGAALTSVPARLACLAGSRPAMSETTVAAGYDQPGPDPASQPLPAS